MPEKIETFVKTHFFALQKVADAPDHALEESSRLAQAFAKTGLDATWQEHMADMESLVGAPIKDWHAGHLARLQGNVLPVWAKRDAYVGGVSTTQRLEELQRQAAETLAKMKFAMVRETLLGHVMLQDADVQSRMKALVSEMYDRSKTNPLAFLDHLAHRRYASTFANSNKPSVQWSKTDKTTELICQLASLTYLEIQTSLQSGNNTEEKDVPTSVVADISVS